MSKISAYQAGRYWQARSGMKYYRHVENIVGCMATDVRSIIDVGSGNTPVLEIFNWATRRVSVDIVAPYRSAAVDGIVCDILAAEDLPRFDLCMCLQVLEHIEDAATFAQRLFTLGDIVLISVPYLWKGKTPGHVHDPVDEAKLRAWTGREPLYSVIVAEDRAIANNRRLISVYDSGGRSAALADMARGAL